MDSDTEEKKEVKVKKEKKEKKEKKIKKEKKDKSEKKSKKESKSTDEISPDEEDKKAESPAPNSPNSSKKRKREEDPNALAIDLSLPTPPSKKALRKMKKHGVAPTTECKPADGETTTEGDSKTPASPAKPAAKPGPHASQSRTNYGVWIGNLSFRTTEKSLKDFLLAEGSPLTETDLARVNLPMNTHGARGNKGFAYVDFKSERGVLHALSLSETELEGRRVLIKSSADFTGRPKKEEKKEEIVDENGEKKVVKVVVKKETHGNPPGKTVFVGNLPFEVTDEEIREHFAYAGEIAKVRTARFQDSGKCKGFTFLDFTSIDSARRAITGVGVNDAEALEGKEEIKLDKIRKDRMRLNGNKLKMEFGEDPQTRYKKRFGSKKRDNAEDLQDRPFNKFAGRGDRGERPERKFDARKIAPGAALAAAPRLTGGIVESTGKKMTFDD